MKRGTESIVRLGKSVEPADFSGINVLSTVILGKKESATKDFNGLFITDAVLLGKKISHAAVVTATVHGVSPLSLPSAVANSLSYVKAFGKTEQRDIPDNYLQRQFIYMMDGSYLLTDIVPTYDGKIEIDFQTTSVVSQGNSYCGGRNTQSPAGFNVGHASDKKLVVSAFSSSAYSSNVVMADNTRYKFTFNNRVATLESGGSTLFTNTFAGTDATGAELGINALNNNGTIGGNTEGIYLYSFKMWNNQGELVADYVPAIQKGTVPVVGFYDTVSKTFKTATAGTFAAGGEAVPTPDTPMDIVSNNGVIKARHQSSLPLSYTLLDYIQSSGSQYIDTKRVPNNNDIIEQKFQKLGSTQTTCSWYGSMPSSTTILPRIGIGSFSNQGVPTLFAGSNYTGSIGVADTNVHTLRFQATGIKELTYTLDGVTSVNVPAKSINMFEPAIELTSYLFARHGTNGVQVYDNEGTKIYYHREYLANGTLVLNMIPVRRNSDNVLGMYDLVSGQFFTNQGAGDFVAGDPVSDPVEIYTDGTVETITDALGNTATAEILLNANIYTDEQEIISGAVTRNVGIKVLDGTEEWTYSSGWSDTTHKCFYVTLDSIKQQTNSSNECLCSHFEWYSRDDLYADKTIIGGCVSGYISTNPESGKALTIRVSSSIAESATDFTQWLADQYAAGTPVIVIYPLATATTESVTGQTLQVQDGDNTLEITQASLSGLELEAQYQKRT